LYLAGGVGVAHYFGHRLSLDLDLFSLRADFDLERCRDEIIREVQGASTLALSDATLRIEIDGALVDIVKYPYALLESPVAGPEQVPVASMLDLAAMKLAAVAQRGIRRDFWDLHEMLKAEVSFEQMFDAYSRRYGAAKSDLYHVIRSLSFFEDAERDSVMPRGLTAAHWLTIRSFFEQAVPEHAALLLK
jgi:hypothetical protein